MITQISPEQIQQVEEKIGYTFRDKNLLQHALTHSSAKSRMAQSNERLEFLGDALIGHIVSEDLYMRFPDCEEGELSSMKSILVSAKTLSACAQRMELEPLVIRGRGLTEKKVLPTSVLCNVFEALVAAVYLDGGFESARTFTLRHVEDKITEIQQNLHEKNYKSILQDYAQKVWSMLPIYKVTQEAGPDHQKRFQIIVEVNDIAYGPAWGNSKKEAEQHAAQLAVQALGLDTSASTSL